MSRCTLSEVIAGVVCYLGSISREDLNVASLTNQSGFHKQSFPNMCRLQNTSFLKTTISSMTITATTSNMMHMISRLCRCFFSAFTNCPTPSSTCKAPCCRCYLDQALPSPTQGRKPNYGGNTAVHRQPCAGQCSCPAPLHAAEIGTPTVWQTAQMLAIEIVEPEVDDAKQRGQDKREKGKPHLEGDLLHVVVDAVEDGALVDDQRGQVLHDLSQVGDGRQDAAHLPVPLVCQRVHAARLHRLQDATRARGGELQSGRMCC